MGILEIAHFSGMFNKWGALELHVICYSAFLVMKDRWRSLAGNNGGFVGPCRRQSSTAYIVAHFPLELATLYGMIPRCNEDAPTILSLDMHFYYRTLLSLLSRRRPLCSLVFYILTATEGLSHLIVGAPVYCNMLMKMRYVTVLERRRLACYSYVTILIKRERESYLVRTFSSLLL